MDLALMPITVTITQLYKTQRTVLNQYECDSTIHLFLTVNVGITGFDNTNNSISIYPNPTSSYIDITLKISIPQLMKLHFMI